MKKTVLLYILLALLFGFFVGLSVPFSYSLCTKGCPTPLLQICEHGFWDWTLRVLQVIGPIAAVIVALFKEDWVAYWYTPSLHIETSMDDLGEQLVRDGENDVASTYTAMLRYSNMGKATANNMSIFVERVIYRQSSDSLTIAKICWENLLPCYWTKAMILSICLGMEKNLLCGYLCRKLKHHQLRKGNQLFLLYICLSEGLFRFPQSIVLAFLMSLSRLHAIIRNLN